MQAAQYVRMSTEHQQYSIDNQKAAIEEYAQQHHLEITDTYIDAGKSGLDLAHRPGLRALLEDITCGRAIAPAIGDILNYQAVACGVFSGSGV
jgi:DNA invertase Pin-like site-specific DNA recombinase